MSQSPEISASRNVVRPARSALIVAALLLAGVGVSLLPSAAEEARAIPSAGAR